MNETYRRDVANNRFQTITEWLQVIPDALEHPENDNFVLKAYQRICYLSKLGPSAPVGYIHDFVLEFRSNKEIVFQLEEICNELNEILRELTIRDKNATYSYIKSAWDIIRPMKCDFLERNSK